MFPTIYICLAQSNGVLLGLAPELVVGIAIVVLVAGALNGVAGFGFALVGTMTLATVVDPATAVVFMIAPILAVNLALVGELSVGEMETCARRFGPLVLAALLGTLAGLLVLDVLPQGPLQIGLGVVSLSFVASAQRVIPVPGLDRTKEACFAETTPAMVGVGGVSGLLFGGTNVGVQFVAYLRSCDLSHATFVGVVAMVFVGLNGVRIGAAGVLGLYPSTAIALASVVAAVPAVAGVWIGKRVRPAISERLRRASILGLLLVIGLRLVTSGLGIA